MALHRFPFCSKRFTACNAPPGAFPTSILSEKKLQLLRNCSHFYFTTITYFSAIASISQRTPFGRDLTATQLLAGLEVKYLAYTSLNAAKSPISAKKQVVLIYFVIAASCCFQDSSYVLAALLSLCSDAFW